MTNKKNKTYKQVNEILRFYWDLNYMCIWCDRYHYPNI